MTPDQAQTLYDRVKKKLPAFGSESWKRYSGIMWRLYCMKIEAEEREDNVKWSQ